MVYSGKWETLVAQIKRFFPNTITLSGALIFLAVYLYVIYWFAVTDVWTNHFFEAGWIYIFYHLFKVIFLFYFSWILYFVGRVIVQFIETKKSGFFLDPLDNFLLSFFVGAAFLRLLMFILGFLNLYYHTVAVLITAPILFLSYPHLKSSYLKAISRKSGNFKKSIAFYTNTALIVIALVISVYILFSQALYLTIDSDVLTHYGPYRNEVIRNHGIQPNNVWYHYYFSKGSGLVFLSMLLTDGEASQLVSFSFFMMSALILFSLIRKVSDDITWPLLATTIYLGAFVDRLIDVSFEKQHVIMAAMLASIVWMMALFQSVPANARMKWTYLCALLTSSLILFVPTSFGLVFPLFLFFLGVYLVTKRFKQAQLLAFLAGAALLTVLATLAINYAATGMLEITPMRAFWSVTNQSKFSQWTSPYMMLYLLEGSSSTLGSISRATISYDFNTLLNLFRLEKVRFFFPHPTVTLILFILLIGYGLIKGLRPRHGIMAVLGPILVTIGIAIIISPLSGQPISTHRYYIFTVFFVVAVSAILWGLFLDMMIDPPLRHLVSYLIVGFVIIWAATDIWAGFSVEWSKQRLVTELKFFTGAGSFGELYQENGIQWPVARKAKNIIGPETRVWSLHNLRETAALPGRNFESEVNYAYKDWHVMVFAEPEQAQQALKNEGFNYFVIDLDRPLGHGALAYSTLFEPDNLDKYFDVILCEHNGCVLTWQGESAQPIPWPPDFLERWSEKLSKPEINYGYPELYQRIKYYYEEYDGRPDSIYINPTLPPARGWQ